MYVACMSTTSARVEHRNLFTLMIIIIIIKTLSSS
jgi:hypothetical protein